MITDGEITRGVADGRDLEDTHVDEVATTEHVTVEANALAEDAARLMLSLGVDCLPVVEGQRLVGTVELADLRRMGWERRPFVAAKEPL